MAVFRVKKTSNYTVMSNHHLQNRNLSLKAKGLLSLMLSLPEGWDYTLNGLTVILHKDGIDNVIDIKLLAKDIVRYQEAIFGLLNERLFVVYKKEGSDSNDDY